MKNTPKQAIIIADDFGISNKSNRRILEIVSLGIIDRVAVMINGVLPDDAIQKLIRSGVKMDIHLDHNNIHYKHHEHRPHENFFTRIFSFLHNYCFKSKNSHQMRIMWEEQILAFQRRFGRFPDGINSHEHIHFFPPYFRVALDLAIRYKIPYLRLGQRPSGILKAIPLVLDALRAFNIKRIEGSGIATSDVLISADWLPDLDYQKHFQASSEMISIEYIYHPEKTEEMRLLQTLSKNSR